jgi:hypothetical protein
MKLVIVPPAPPTVSLRELLVEKFMTLLAFVLHMPQPGPPKFKLVAATAPSGMISGPVIVSPALATFSASTSAIAD